MTPTTNFMVLSGTRANGARTARPAAATTSTAMTPARAARGMSFWLLPNESTMNTTSRPSRTTPLKDRVKADQSSTKAFASGATCRVAAS